MKLRHRVRFDKGFSGSGLDCVAAAAARMLAGVMAVDAVRLAEPVILGDEELPRFISALPVVVYSTSTRISLDCEGSVFGTHIASTPSLYVALTASSCRSAGKVNERRKLPYSRSVR